MSRLWQSGFELRSIATGIEFDSSTGTPTIDTTTFRGGSASLRVNGTSISKFITHQYSGTGLAQDRFFRFYIRIATASSVDSVATALLRDNTNGNGLSLRMNINRTLELWDEQAGIQRGSDSSALALNTWYRIELQYNRAAGTGSAYIDGVQFATGVQSANLDMNIIRLGMIDTATCDLNFDDIAVNDSSGSNQTTLPGSGSIIHLKPNATGDTNSFAVQVGGTIGSANNFTRVNEITPNDATSYNGSTILNQEDLFNCDDSGIGAGDTVNVVAIGARMADLVATDTTAAFKLEIEKTASGTKSQSSTIVPNSTAWITNASVVPRNYPLVTYKDPDNSNWTQITLDSMQIGYTLTATNIRTIAISTIWASLDYTPSVDDIISKSDAISVTENITISINSFINGSDSIIVTESSTILLVDNPTASDTISIAESLSHYSDCIDVMELSRIVLVNNISVSDSLTITESIQRALISNISVNDNISLSENVTIQIISGALGINVSDSITVTESRSIVTPTLLLSVSDSITVTESVSSILAIFIPVTIGLITASNLSTNGDNVGRTIYTTASVAPAANALILLWVYSISSTLPSTPTVTGNGLTWVEITHVDDTSVRKLTLFRAMGSSPTTGTLSIDFASQTQNGATWSIAQFTNVDTSGSNGSGAIIQNQSNFSASNTTSLTVTLANFASIGNATAGGFGFPLNNAATVGGGFTQVGERHQNTPNLALITEFNTNNDTTVDATWSPSVVPSTGIAIEIKPYFTSSEGVTINDNNAETIENSINVSDIVTASELILAALVDTRSVSDTINITESLSHYSDQIDIIEFLSVSLIYPPLSISTSDSIAITENRQILCTSFISVSNTITIIESVKATKAYQVNVNDTTTISESQQFGVTDLYIQIVDNRLTDENGDFILDEQGNFIYTEGPSDSITITENVVSRLESNRAVNDNLNITESILLLLTANASINDTISITENNQLLLESRRSVNDTISITEQANLVINLSIITNDTLIMSESVVNGGVPDITASDTFILSEAILVQTQGGIAELDAVAISENIALTIALPNISIFDSSSLNENIKASIESNIQKTDNLTVNENTNQDLTIEIFANDLLTITENTKEVIESLVNVNDQINHAENVAIITSPVILISDSVSVTDLPNILLNFSVDVNEHIALSESVTALIANLAVVIKEDIVIDESPDLFRDPLSIEITDNLTIIEAINIFTKRKPRATTDSTIDLRPEDPGFDPSVSNTDGSNNVDIDPDFIPDTADSDAISKPVDPDFIAAIETNDSIGAIQ